jgi:putative transposase
MLSDDDLLLWYQKLALSESARTLIDSIRSSEPVRRVGGGASNVVGRYPSRKMGRVIQFESHRVELAFVLEFEHDEGVLEYYDQPSQLPLQYSGRSGRRVNARHTPDFFVLRTDTAGWEECKTDQELLKLAEKCPHRYKRAEDGTWCCPPGDAYATSRGLYYRIRNSGEICWTLQRNIQYLHDYLRTDLGEHGLSHKELLLGCTRRNPGVSLGALLETARTPDSRDCLYSMIARGELYVDLRASSLWEPDGVHVFPERDAAQHQEVIAASVLPRLGTNNHGRPSRR